MTIDKSDIKTLMTVFAQYENVKSSSYLSAEQITTFLSQNNLSVSDGKILEILEEMCRADWLEYQSDVEEIGRNLYRISPRGELWLAKNTDFASLFGRALSDLPSLNEAKNDHMMAVLQSLNLVKEDDEVDVADQFDLPVVTLKDKIDFVSSSTWTGLPSDFVFNDDLQRRTVRELDVIETYLESVDISQQEKSQARAYVIAMRALAEAPDPPAELIWEILGRASELAGVASLFVSVIALFATVTK